MGCLLVLENLLNYLNLPLSELRLDYLKIAAVIDDLITLAYSFNICFKNVWKCAKLLDNLDFVVNPEKSVFAPSLKIKYMVFIINSVTVTLRLITEKKRKIFHFCHEVLLK